MFKQHGSQFGNLKKLSKASTIRRTASWATLNQQATLSLSSDWSYLQRSKFEDLAKPPARTRPDRNHPILFRKEIRPLCNRPQEPCDSNPPNLTQPPLVTITWLYQQGGPWPWPWIKTGYFFTFYPSAWPELCLFAYNPSKYRYTLHKCYLDLDGLVSLVMNQLT